MTDARPTLVADIGATNARFGLMDGNAVRDSRVFPCADFPSVAAATESYLASVGAATGASRPARGAFAIAGPVTGDRIAMTNLVWSFSAEEVRAGLEFERLKVVNDFTAVALSVPRLGADDRVQVGDGSGVPDQVVGVIGPGSGLGVSGLIPVAARPGHWTALSGEGGHVTMAAVSDHEAAVLAQLRKRFDHVSAERVLSGPGLVNLYEALAILDGREPPPATPAAVTAAALDGSDRHAGEAVEMFCAMLGTVAGNLALSLGARGGVYIAGGIVPRLGSLFLHSRFRKRFVEKGRMRDFLGPIPTFVVTHPLPAFLGLAQALEQP